MVSYVLYKRNHKRFLDKELTAISESYLKLLNTKAISLLASNDLYVSQYVKLDFKKNDIEADRNVLGSGQLMLRFKRIKESLERTNILQPSS